MQTGIEQMDIAWERGLQVLDPTPSELEHGLRLHREFAICEHYGFLPKVYPSQVVEQSNGLQDRGVGIYEWKEKSWSYRVRSATEDVEGALEYLEALDRAGVSAIVQPVNDVGESFQGAITLAAGYRHVCNIFKDRLFQATCADDPQRAFREGRTAVFFSLTGLPLAETLHDPEALFDWVDIWYQMGVRFMHLGYNRRNYFADGCTETNDGGLSDLGRDLLKRMERVGIIADLPHSSRKTVADAVAIAEKPLIASHIGCAALHDHPRCKTDNELKAIAGTGGYIGILAVPSLLGPKADLNLLLRHVAHAVKTVGAEHVVIATDIGYDREWPDGMLDYRIKAGTRIDRGGWKASGPSTSNAMECITGSLAWTNWPLITVGLLKIGLREEEIAKILGGNLRRVLRACQPAKEAEAAALVAVRHHGNRQREAISVIC